MPWIEPFGRLNRLLRFESLYWVERQALDHIVWVGTCRGALRAKKPSRSVSCIPQLSAHTEGPYHWQLKTGRVLDTISDLLLGPQCATVEGFDCCEGRAGSNTL